MVNASSLNPGSLLLEVWINGRTQHRVLLVQSVSGEIYAQAPDLALAGLRLGETEMHGKIAMHALKGVTCTVDQSNQRLLITASAERLPQQDFDLRPSIAEIPASTSARGVSLSYDLSGTLDDAAHPRSTGS